MMSDLASGDGFAAFFDIIDPLQKRQLPPFPGGLDDHNHQ